VSDEVVTHSLKTWPAPFAAVVRGEKTYEVRCSDRGYKVGDLLVLLEWDPETEAYSGQTVLAVVNHMTASGEWGLPDDLCVMGISTIGAARRWPR